MATKRLSNEFMDNVLTEEAWSLLSQEIPWTEQMLEKYKDKVNWKEVSDNSYMLWTPSMLEKFKKQIDWQQLSSTHSTTILTEACLEQYRNYWDWMRLSRNSYLRLTQELIEKFIDKWDWEELIDRYDDDSEHLFTMEFLERYRDKIPTLKLNNSNLWKTLIRERASEMKSEIVS